MGMTDLRAAFPALADGLCFMDWAATGLLPASARDGVAAYLEDLVWCAGAESTWMHGVHGETRNRVRQLVASLVEAAPSDVALTESTTAGLNLAAASLPAEPGDNVVLSGLDYLAVSTPWKQRAEREGFELRFVQGRAGWVTAEDLLAAADSRTRAIAASTIGWTSGALLDARTLACEARQRRIPCVLDGIQTFGVVPFSLAETPASFFAVGGHKWLCSTLGTGFLVVHPDAARAYPPPLPGFLSGAPPRGSWMDWFQDPLSRPDEPVTFAPSGRTFETGGTPCYPGAIGLLSSLRLLSDAGPARILEHVRELGTRLIAGLDALGLDLVTPRAPAERAGIIVASARNASGGGGAMGGEADANAALARRLREERIVVSVRYCRGVGGVRISLHGMNDAADVDRLLAALKRLRSGI